MDWTALDFEKLANALVILVTGIAIAFGFRGGRRAPADKTADLAVATDFFDAQAIGLLTKEVTGQAFAITAQTVATREHTEALKEQTRAVIDLREEVQELRHEMGRRR